ncbi:sensor histidine kinase [Streptomyces sp. DT24]|uniref:sensor histidine kinase n=1 Tax=Streptomyces sp. DT24 TaxID=3416520 RepID=UPI003CEF0366
MKVRPPRPMSLLSRLVLGTAVLATVAVLASQAIGFLVLDSWLTDRVDRQLIGFHVPSPAYQDAVSEDGFPENVRKSGMLPTDFRVHFYDDSGRLSDRSLGEADRPGPALPFTLPDQAPAPGRPETVPATSGSSNWRVLRVTGPRGMVAVVALPLDTVDGATSELLWLNLTLLALTAIGLTALGHGVVRLGLLPLTRMERTARKISAGDLGLRLPDTDARTEIGRLGHALNTMLERLREALRQRAASEERLRRFVADAGHELRTPLTSIQGFSQLLLRERALPGQEQAQAHRLIAQNAERMNLLVDDLSLLAKLDHEPSYTWESVDLLAVAADAIATTAVRHTDHPVDLGPLRTLPPPGPGELEMVEAVGDTHRLLQVMVNLLTNALIHTPPGTPVHVRVGTVFAGPNSGGTPRLGRTSGSRPLSCGARISVIEVADEGPGLSREDAARVFERFHRAGPSRTCDQGGTGLGLAIASVIAEGHGGRLELDARPGRGCTFRLVLPAPPENAEDAADGGPTPRARPTPPRRGPHP